MRVYIILKSELKYITKEIARVLSIMIIGLILIIAIILIKYKPIYEVTIAGETVGYTDNKNKIETLIKDKIINQEGKSIDSVTLKNLPIYDLKLVKRNKENNSDEILQKIQEDNTIITYKYYKVSLNNESQALVETIEQAEEIVNKIKAEYDGDGLSLDLQIIEEYKDNVEEIVDTVEVATVNFENKVEELKKIEEEKNTIAKVNGINLSALPVSGTITSRYGELSSRRRSSHTGLDIASKKGTTIKATASGTVIFAATSGSYGKLVKIDHGNNVQTWYGHCNTINTKVGTKVEAGDKIATVGSTGNSTGPHLHFEIRINNKTVNPQRYLY